MRTKIEDNNDLERDMKSGAIINKNRSAYLLAKKAREARIKSKQKIEDLEARINKLEELISRIT